LAHGGCKEVFATKSPCPTAGAAKDKNKKRKKRKKKLISKILKFKKYLIKIRQNMDCNKIRKGRNFPPLSY